MSGTTERLYYNDPYTLTFDAQVVECLVFKDRLAVVLDRSYFYPESGGQLYDTGTLNGVAVLDVQIRPSDRALLHFLSAALPDGTDAVHGEIDGDRRRDLRLHHSGQHILSQALVRAAHAETVSVHMGLDTMTIDVGRGLLNPDELTAVEEVANRAVQDDLPIRTWFPSPAEIATLPLRKVPEVDGALRVVDIGGFDVTACGGTHVARTAEIGLIKLIKQEKQKQGARLEFKCGVRALADYRIKHDALSRLATDFSVAHADVPDSVARIRDENKQLRAELKTFREQAIETEAQALLAAAENRNGYRLVTAVFDGRDADSVRGLAQRIAAQPGAVALFGISGVRAQVICARADDLTISVVPVLQAALRTLGTDRGGGRPNFAQGGGVPAERAQVVAALEAAKAALA
ncbi:MAG: alanyl-tRNA editing protein [Aggregatilineales bacterium]